MSIKPLYDRVVIKKDAVDEVTTGGIFLTSSTVDKPSRGTVLAIGIGKLLDDGSIKTPEVKVNDKVIFAKGAGVDVEVAGTTYLILHEAEIMGILV